MSDYFANKERNKEMADVIRERFPEILENRPFTPDPLIRQRIREYITESRKTVRQVMEEYNKKYKIPVSRLKTNSMINELEAIDDIIKIEREDDQKFIYLIKNERGENNEFK
jgi:hypothetical protein